MILNCIYCAVGLIIAIIVIIMDNVNVSIKTGGNIESGKTIIKLSDFNNRLKYKSGMGKQQRPTIHVGQRKLFLNELQFMTKYRPEIVVYAGAAPSMHIWRLHELFPETKFLLIDPNEFCIIKRKGVTHYDDPTGINYLEVGTDRKNYVKTKQIILYNGKLTDKETVRGIKYTENIKYNDIVLTTPITIIENYFTIDLARDVAKLGKVAFWSDIRINSEAMPTELDIYFNSAQQLTWVDIIKPVATMLKFRCPYIEAIRDEPNVEPYMMEYFDYCKALQEPIDFVADYRKKIFRYINGDIFIQPWAGGSSTEGRLVFSDVSIVNYDSREYEEKFFYYNNKIRPIKHFGHAINKKHCIDRCGDCALETAIWSDYCKDKDVMPQMIELSHYMGPYGRNLCTKPHGQLY